MWMSLLFVTMIVLLLFDTAKKQKFRTLIPDLFQFIVRIVTTNTLTMYISGHYQTKRSHKSNIRGSP